MLSIRNVSKWFGSRRVLDAFSLDVAPGERVVLVGGNGCGKSTLIQLVCGVLDGFRGSVALPSTIGYAPEKPDIPDHLLAVEWLDLVASLKRSPWKDDLGVGAFLGKKISALSLGQRQRVSLVAAFTGDPALLVLDEPTNALDRDSRHHLVERVRATTALIATHDRDFADCVATRVIDMSAARTATGG